MRFVLLRVIAVALVLSGLLTEFTPVFTPRVLAAPPCSATHANLVRNGSVQDGGYDTAHGVVANSWNAYLVSGDWPQYQLADNESANGDLSGSSSQYIHGDGIVFDAGIYQIVTGVQPGASYDFSVGWAAMLRDIGGGQNKKPDNTVFRRVGVDPTGGTDPNASTVQWGPEVGTGSSGRSLNNPDLSITFEALASTVTVFLRAYNHSSSASDKVFFDVMCVMPRPDIAVQSVEPTAAPTAPPTDTPPAPPTRRPPTPVPDTPVPPTATPIPPTPIPARVLTVTPRAVALQNDTSSASPRPFIPGNGSDDSANASSGGFPLFVVLGIIGVLGAGLLGVIGIGGFIAYRMFNRQVDDALDSTYYPDDQYPYQR